MTTAHQDMFHARQARLQTAAQHWQEKIAYGDPSTGWEGDRALVMYYEPITDEIVIQYELPNQEPVLVFKVPADGFDIHRVTSLLRDADHRRRTPEQAIAEVDAHNAKVEAENQYQKDQKHEAAKEKLGWAIRKDTGNHIAPLHVTKNPHRPGVVPSNS